MRILHTSDWHLGKSLEGFSRMEEQKLFLDELQEIVEEKDVDMLLIAGDIYDSSNPSASAESLFYESLKRLSGGGKRAIIVIAGNHDNPERLTASSPLACEQGIILLGKPGSKACCGQYGELMIEDSGPGYLRISLRGEKAVILTLPYPSEKRLNEIISEDDEDEERQKSYSERVGEFFQGLSHYYSSDSINLAVTHLFIRGGEESDSERPVQLGGSLAVDAEMLPDAQYIALGHLHRPQRIRNSSKKAYYSGSPLQYSRSEMYYSKAVFLVDVKAGQEAEVEELHLHNYKAIEVWECESIEDALQQCYDKQDGERWVYVDIHTDRTLTGAEIKEMKSLRRDIVQIHPIFPGESEEKLEEMEDYRNLNIEELFTAFYRSRIGEEPPEEIMEIFYQVIQEEGEDSETSSAKN